MSKTKEQEWVEELNKICQGLYLSQRQVIVKWHKSKLEEVTQKEREDLKWRYEQEMITVAREARQEEKEDLKEIIEKIEVTGGGSGRRLKIEILEELSK